MLDESYLDQGLTALGRSASRPMAGHTGAALIAAYFFSRENELEEGAGDLLREIIDEIVAKDGEEWGLGAEKPDDLPALFAPYPQEATDPDLLSAIPAALEQKIALLRASGHCTIFISLALKALKHRPEMVRPAVVEGICRLIANFGDSPGQGYYGEEAGWRKGVAVDPEVEPAPYEDLGTAVVAACYELIADDKIKRAGYGGLVHLTTHTNALVELTEMGYGALAQRGFSAHRAHIALLRGLPPYHSNDGQEVRLVPAEHGPCTRAYWQVAGRREISASHLHRGGVAHAIKVSYAAFHLLGAIEDDGLRDCFVREIGYLT
ncbi:MAG TPA: hypothetical protein EYG11_17090 [Candidatus Latescibacteria bacterium]|nr:hypothetical protein [Candidatus Handelsmanbacteria bacterium]HIL10419.1 hypothetical protein [Candidatus Latescibacterota bacterium]